MSDEHPYAKPAAEGSIQKSGHCLLLPDVLTTVAEPLGQGRHHVLVVLHQSSGGVDVDNNDDDDDVIVVLH